MKKRLMLALLLALALTLVTAAAASASSEGVSKGNLGAVRSAVTNSEDDGYLGGAGEPMTGRS